MPYQRRSNQKPLSAILRVLSFSKLGFLHRYKSHTQALSRTHTHTHTHTHTLSRTHTHIHTHTHTHFTRDLQSTFHSAGSTCEQLPQLHCNSELVVYVSLFEPVSIFNNVVYLAPYFKRFVSVTSAERRRAGS